MVSATSASTRYQSLVAHAVDLVLTTALGLALGVLAALGHALLGRARPALLRSRWIPRVAWTALHAPFVVLGLGEFVDRRAHALASYPLTGVLRVLLLLAAIAAPALVMSLGRALVAPASARRRRRLARFGGGLGVLVAAAGTIANGRLFRGDHPEVHAAIVWLLGLFVSELAFAWISRRWSSWPSARRTRIALGLGAAALAAIAFVPPSNRVRLLVFRSPTALGARVFAATWSVPSPPPVAAALLSEARPEDETAPARGVRLIDGAPIVVLCTIDSMRADALFQADPARRLPNLTALARSSAAFTSARAAASDGVWSLASLFSSRPPSTLRWAPSGEGATFGDYPAEGSPRLASVLESSGVATTSIVSAGFLAGSHGVASGFGEERTLAGGRGRALAPAVMRETLDVLAAIDERPRFVFAHFTDAHYPYSGPVGRASAGERYVAALEAIDRELGALLERVASPELRDRVLLIVVGDHGEPFGEHRFARRARSLYEEVLRVPFLVHGPHVKARAVGDPVGLIDVAPTVLDVFGARAPEAFTGATLVPLLAGLDAPRARRFVAEAPELRAIWSPPLKLIVDERQKTLELFDLDRDPSETMNLAP
ncbi:MAG: sulfatase-like hydrolase/transferase [Polyangiaceae bacterium]